MRHRKRRSKLSIMPSHRKAMLRNMAKNLLKHQRIKTTLAKAKETRRVVEKLITVSRTDSVAARRMAYAVLADRDLVMKLFKEISPLFKARTSGYTRIIPLGFRLGDGAQLCFLELTEKTVVEKLPKKKKAKAEEEKTEGAEPEKAKHEKAHPAKEEKKEAKKEEPKIKTISKSKLTPEEERNREKAKSEDMKVADKRGFMKNLRGIFRKRGDR